MSVVDLALVTFVGLVVGLWLGNWYLRPSSPARVGRRRPVDRVDRRSRSGQSSTDSSQAASGPQEHPRPTSDRGCELTRCSSQFHQRRTNSAS